MANYFDEERVKCSCGSELFSKVESFMIKKDSKDPKSLYKIPYKTFVRCINCSRILKEEAN